MNSGAVRAVASLPSLGLHGRVDSLVIKDFTRKRLDAILGEPTHVTPTIVPQYLLFIWYYKQFIDKNKRCDYFRQRSKYISFQLWLIELYVSIVILLLHLSDCFCTDFYFYGSLVFIWCDERTLPTRVYCSYVVSVNNCSALPPGRVWSSTDSRTYFFLCCFSHNFLIKIFYICSGGPVVGSRACADLYPFRLGGWIGCPY